MAPPTQLLNLDVEAISGICGSISIACWVVVFSPQIVENFRRSSADGLSIQFIIVWLLGDVFNILGAVLQGVLPTMIILAIYYTIADIVLLGQCFYYRGFTWRDDTEPAPKQQQQPDRSSSNGDSHHNTRTEPSERTSLLLPSAMNRDNNNNSNNNGTLASSYHSDRERRGSSSDWSHLNPVVPFIPPDDDLEQQLITATPTPRRPESRPMTKSQTLAFNSLAVFMVCAAGVAGWWLSRDYYVSRPDNDSNSNSNHLNIPNPNPPSSDGGGGGGGEEQKDLFEFNFWGQVFGWLCAVLYLGSRLPQLLLNFRRKSTDGVSILFFLFACLGNLTYVMSILAFDPDCAVAAGGGSSSSSQRGGGSSECRPGEAAHIYWEYILVNLSWLAGSAGTLLLDFAIFVQFFIYDKGDEEDGQSEDGDSMYGEDEEEDADPYDEESVGGGRDEEEEVGRIERGQRGGGGGNRGGRREFYDQRPVLERGLSDFTR